MHVIMGGTGHVGSAVADALLGQGQPVMIVTRDAARADAWRHKGAQVAVADIHHVAALRDVFRRGRRAFLLNPPADVGSDTDAVERGSVANILAALEGSGLEKVVAASTAGAQPGDRIGDLSVLWHLEQGLQRQAIPAAINRAGYYMSNWDGVVAAVRSSGKLPTMFPAGLALPMVAPRDLGEAAAARLTSSTADCGIRYVEGPGRYTSSDVAKAFAQALGRTVSVAVTPRGQWRDAYRQMGFSEAAADSYARMTATSTDGGFAAPDDPIRGRTSLETYVGELVRRA